MAFNAWVALAPCSIKRTLIDGRLLCENLYRYREGPHSSPKTGLEALPGVRPAMFNIFFKHMFTKFLKHILTYSKNISCSIMLNVFLTYFTRNTCCNFTCDYEKENRMICSLKKCSGLKTTILVWFYHIL